MQNNHYLNKMEITVYNNDYGNIYNQTWFGEGIIIINSTG